MIKTGKVEQSSQESECFTPIQSSNSAFKPCKLEIYHVENCQDNSIQAYINKRIIENSFSLSSIEDSFFVNKDYEKAETLFQETSQIAQNSTSHKPAHNLQIVTVYNQKITSLKNTHPFKKLKLDSNNLFQIVNPLESQKKPSNTLKKQQADIQLSLSLEQSFQYNFSQHFFQQNGFPCIKQQQQSNTKSKKEKKKEKIRSKSTYIRQPSKQPTKIQQKKSKRSNNTRRNQNKKDQIFIKQQQQQELSGQQYNEQILKSTRICKCCGKIIDKLCFKCPHLYCRKQDCPRKRKKLLNQKMLQKMKIKKIQEYQRQRKLYQKIRNEKKADRQEEIKHENYGITNFNSQKNVNNNENSNKKKRKTRTTKTTNQSSISYDECLKSDQSEDQTSNISDQSVQDQKELSNDLQSLSTHQDPSDDQQKKRTAIKSKAKNSSKNGNKNRYHSTRTKNKPNQNIKLTVLRNKSRPTNNLKSQRKKVEIYDSEESGY